MTKLELKVDDRVNIITMHGMDVGYVESGTVVSVYKNGIYKVLPDSRKYDNYCYKFRPDGIECGTTWKDYTYTHIEKIEDATVSKGDPATRLLTHLGVL